MRLMFGEATRGFPVRVACRRRSAVLKDCNKPSRLFRGLDSYLAQPRIWGLGNESARPQRGHLTGWWASCTHHALRQGDVAHRAEDVAHLPRASSVAHTVSRSRCLRAEVERNRLCKTRCAKTFHHFSMEIHEL